MRRRRASEWAHAHLPAAVVAAVRRARAALFWTRVGVHELPRWAELRRDQPRRDGVFVYYGRDRVPASGELVLGGAVKFSRLADAFPNRRRGWNVLYLGSSSLPLDARALVRITRERGARLAFNQDGIRYPGLGLPQVELVNRRNARLMHAADHVFFQSVFCKESADRFLGERRDRWEILYNAVDTTTFVPAPERRQPELTLLLGGSQYQRYRVETALRTLALLPDARLVVTGALSFDREDEARRFVHELADGLGVSARVELTGPYSQADAPALIQRAHMLLHTKYNDPCPSIVIEAMACGLPVVYSASGGVPELIGEDAGVGVPAPRDFARDHPPAPEALAAAVREAADRVDEMGAVARARAVERFDLRPWIERHRAVFERLLAE